MTAARRRVMIVDDMESVRRIVRMVLEDDPGIEVVGEAGDPYEAREKIKQLNPDVLTLDVEMPRMNGDVFLKKIMTLRPMPVVMLSYLTKRGSAIAVNALADGAVECIEKPQRLEDMTDGRFAANLRRAIETAARVKLHRRVETSATASRAFEWNGRHVFIGSSTGGVEAIENVLRVFPANCPPTVIAQHMPRNFIESFAERLDGRYPFRVRVAEEGDRLMQGNVYFAPGGDTDLRVMPGRAPRLALVPHSDMQAYCPSVDLLLRSAVRLGNEAVGAILTGMGRDGADALLAMREAGASTVVQDEKTSVVYGMPRAAAELGAAGAIRPIQELGGALLDLCSKSPPEPRDG